MSLKHTLSLGMGSAVLAIALLGVAFVGTTPAEPTETAESMTITHDLEMTLTGVQADGEARTVWITMPDRLEGQISVESVSASSSYEEARASTSVVDGPDEDGTAETIAVEMSVSGDATEPVRLKLDVVGTYPDVRNESVPSVRVLTGETRFGIDTDDAVVEAALDDTTLTGPTISNALFGITTEGDANVGTLTLEASGDGIPDSPMEIPLDRLPSMNQPGVETTTGHDHTEMHANVSADAGQSVAMAVEPTTNGSVAVDSISLVPRRSGSFTLDLVRTTEPMEGFPEMNTTGKEPLGYLDIEHSISNEDIESTSITVRVAKEKVRALEDTDRDEVGIYRHNGTGWAEKNVEYLGATPTHFVYQVTEDGFSEWATAGKQASFRITETRLNVTSDVIQVNDGVRVSVRIENRGEADGEYNTELVLNDATVDERTVSVAAGGTTQVNFDRQLKNAATYEVQVNDVIVDEIEVEPREGSSDDTGDTDGDAGLPMVPIAAGVIALLAVFGGAVLLARD